jgi:hypothetical protein
VVLLALVIIIGLAITLRDALTSRGVVIESFDTPSSLAAGGITGKVQLEVSEVGISIGEIRRLLKARFGHDLHISGDVVEAPSDLAVTARLRKNVCRRAQHRASAKDQDQDCENNENIEAH